MMQIYSILHKDDNKNGLDKKRKKKVAVRKMVLLARKPLANCLKRSCFMLEYWHFKMGGGGDGCSPSAPSPHLASICMELSLLLCSKYNRNTIYHYTIAR